MIHRHRPFLLRPRSGALALAGLLALAAATASSAPGAPGAAPPPPNPAPPLPAAPPAWMHRAWTARDHAPRFVQSLAQDRDGFLWVGSVEGLFRFDGTTFQPVAPPPGHPRAATAVSALAAAPDGAVWLGYAGGGGMAVYRHGRIEDAGKPGDASEITRIVIGPDGEPWIGAGDADHAVYRHTPAGWQAVVNPVFDASEGEPQLTSAQGELWFNTWNGGLLRGRPGSSPFHPQVWPVGPSGGSALVQTGDASLYLIDRYGLRAVSSTRPDTRPGPAPRMIVPGAALPRSYFYRAVADPFGRIWATTYVSGVLAIWPHSGALERITERDGLTSDRASPILADRDGNVWIGTERGLDRFSPTPLRSVADVAPPATSGMVATALGGRAYLGNGRAVFAVDPGQAPRRLATLNDDGMGLCAGANGDVWALEHTRAVALAGPHRGQVSPLPKPVVEMFDCAVAPDGTLWVSGSGLGLIRRTATGWAPLPIESPLGPPRTLAFDARGRLVMILGRRGLARLDQQGKLTVWDGRQIGFERPGSLTVRANDVLVGGTTGLLRLGERDMAVLDVADHPWLFDTRGIIETRGGTTWLLGYRGLSRVATAALDRAFAAPRRPIPHTTFDDDDRRIALPQPGAGEQMVVDGSDRVLALTRSGVLAALPWSSPLPETPYRLFVRALDVNGHEVPASGAPELPVGTTQVTLRYGVLDLATPSQRRFRVRLTGLDETWASNGAAQDISYANLAPGAYRFEVQTTDRQGAWQPQGAALAFTIRAAFWQTTWFRLAVAAVILLLARALYLQRTRVLLARARAKREGQVAERERIARELHDTLLQGVQGLILRFQAVAARASLDPATRNELDAVLERGDDVVTAARDRVIDLRAQSAAAVDLAQALAPLCTEGRDDVQGPPVLVRTSGKPRPVAAGVAEECLAVAQEAVENARRHAAAQVITVALHFGPRALILRISDDGVGFAGAPRGAQGHFGLVGMRERAGRLRARIDIRNGAQGGAVVQLRVPGRIAYRA